MGLDTTNPGAIPGELLQWDEYFFLPYYDNLLELADVKILLQKEGIFSDCPAPLKNKERGNNV